MKKPWKDMEFTEEELRDIDNAGRAPRSPKAHQPDMGPSGWLAPPPGGGKGQEARRHLFEELDQAVESAFSAVAQHPAEAVQWLDPDVLVTDPGAESSPGTTADPVDAAMAESVVIPPDPVNHEGLVEIPVDVELGAPSEDPGGKVPVPADPGNVSGKVTAEGSGKPAAVDAVFRALAGGAGENPDARGPDEPALVSPPSVSVDRGQGGEEGGAESSDVGPDSQISDVEDTLSEMVGASAEVDEPDEEAPTMVDEIQKPGSTETVRMSGLPVERGSETVRMVPPPPVPPGASATEAAFGGATEEASLSGPDLSTAEGGLELDVELDSLSGMEPQGSAGGQTGSAASVSSAAARKDAVEGSGSERDESTAETVAQPAGAESIEKAAVGTPPPVPGDKKAPPPLPPADKVPPPVPGDKNAPPPVPVVETSTTVPGSTGSNAVDAGSAERDDASQVKPPKPPKPQDAVRRKPWYQDFFDDDYLPTLPHETPESTLKEVDFLLSEMALPEGGRVLDLGCGYGRHAVEFAARGFSVVGLDNSLPMLIKAAEYTQMRGVEVEFVQADMREMSFEEEFDAVYCFGTTFGYFGDDENRDILKRMNRSLKPGGRFVLEVVNRDYLLADLPLRVWWEGDGCLVMDEVDFNYFTSRVEAHRTVVFNEGRQIERNMSIRVYSLHELGIQLFQAGLRVLKITGHLATRGRFFGMHSPHLIVTATKKG